MSDLIANDNVAPPASAGAHDATDAHGQAAMLLVESLIHGLVARSIIEVADAVEILAIAADTQQEIDVEPRDPAAPTLSSRTLLEAIGDSLAHDLAV